VRSVVIDGPDSWSKVGAGAWRVGPAVAEWGGTRDAVVAVVQGCAAIEGTAAAKEKSRGTVFMHGATPCGGHRLGWGV
jgi:hypothetical protein